MNQPLRLRIRALGLVAAFVLIFLGLAAPARAGAVPAQVGAPPGGKITLCHATSSASNPYVSITVDPAAVYQQGHDSHPNDIIPAFEGYPGSALWQSNPDYYNRALASGCVLPPCPTPTPPPNADSHPHHHGPDAGSDDGNPDADGDHRKSDAHRHRWHAHGHGDGRLLHLPAVGRDSRGSGRDARGGVGCPGAGRSQPRPAELRAPDGFGGHGDQRRIRFPEPGRARPGPAGRGGGNAAA